MSFSTALSGLNAASTSLNVLGNNIANSQTTGFKESVAQFADVYSSSLGGVSKIQPGSGVQVTDVAQQFAAGTITPTNSSLDLAINGNGFFTMAANVNLPDPKNPNVAVNPSIPTSYTRSGSFQINSTGQVVNSQGQYLLTFAPNGTTAAAGFSVGVFRPLTIDTSQGLPSATANIDMKLNINGAATLPITVPFNPTDSTSFNNTTSVTTYDTQGNAHIVSTYYVKTPVANSWDAYLFLDGYGVTSGGPAVPPSAAPASTVSPTLNAPGLPIPMTFTASGRLGQVGNLAATAISAGAVTAATTAAQLTTTASGLAAQLVTTYNSKLASDTAVTAATTEIGTIVTDTTTASASATLAAANTANLGMATTAFNDATNFKNATTAAAPPGGVNVTAVLNASANFPSTLALANAYSTALTAADTAATTSVTAATNYQADVTANVPLGTVSAAQLALDGTALTTAATAADNAAIAAQNALNSYNAAVVTAVTNAKQAALVAAQAASTSAQAFAAATSVVNTVTGLNGLASTAKTVAATAATDAANLVTKLTSVFDVNTSQAAATSATTMVADIAIAQNATTSYNNAVINATATATPTTSADFGSINLTSINPSVIVAPMAFNLNFLGTTQFATPFSVNGLTQDGLAAGNLTGISVDATGVVSAAYSNGGSKPLGQVALARFQNNQGLAKIGGTAWAQSSGSGAPIYGAAGDNNFGGIQSSALEGSNVDLSAQLVNLIVAQQAYQASAQTITTEKTLVETILRA